MVLEDACPLCGAKEFSVKHVLTDPDFKTVRCADCSFLFMHPYPTDEFLENYYKARELYGLQGEADELYKRSLADRVTLFQGLFSKITPALRGGYAVDFGAGIGMVVAALRQLGFDAIGLEKNPLAAAVGKRLFDVEVSGIELGEISKKIDVFTLFDVLEHIKYPKDFLQFVHTKMTDLSVIIGAVPNYNALDRMIHGSASTSLIFPEHVSQFTRRSLRDTLDRAGFDVVYIGFPPLYAVRFTWGLRRMLRELKIPLISFALDKIITKMKKYILYPIPNFFCEKTGLLGVSMVFVAKRRA
jgi:hypothetical protein